ncbi:MAG: hypothetical protein QM765_35680 [Myxococcales bacterium]
MSSDPALVYWSAGALCVVQGDGKAPHAPVRCYDPKTKKWGKKEPRDGHPPHRDSKRLHAELSEDTKTCVLILEGRSLDLSELGLSYESELPSWSRDCDKAEGSDVPVGTREWFIARCPTLMALSPDGSALAFVFDVVHETVDCSTMGHRNEDGESKVIRTVLMIAPVEEKPNGEKTPDRP